MGGRLVSYMMGLLMAIMYSLPKYAAMLRHSMINNVTIFLFDIGYWFDCLNMFVEIYIKLWNWWISGVFFLFLSIFYVIYLFFNEWYFEVDLISKEIRHNTTTNPT